MGEYLIQSEPCASEAVRSPRRAKCKPRNNGYLELQFGEYLKDHSDLCWKVASAKLCSGVDQQYQLETDQCSVAIHCGTEAQCHAWQWRLFSAEA